MKPKFRFFRRQRPESVAQISNPRWRRFATCAARASRLAISIVSVLTAAIGARAASYIITNSPGYNLICNQLDSPNGNGIRNVIPTPTVPPGSTVQKFSLATKSFQTLETFTSTGGWSPGTNILNTGEGIYFFNNSAGNFNMTISGNLHSPTGLPLNIGPAMVLVGRQTNDIASVTNILGYNPPVNTIVYRFLPGTGHDPNVFNAVNYTIHANTSTGWVTPPGPPNAIRVGESVWITTNGIPPIIVSQPQSQLVCRTDSGSATFTVVATGSAPLSYRWFLNNNPISGATSNTYTKSPVLAADIGTYFVQVSNPLGTTTSSNATLAVGDATPPTILCGGIDPAPCSGPNGTVITYNPSATDNCDGANLPVTCVPPSGTAFPVGTTTVTCTATDSHGNKGNCSFPVTVVDNKAPTLTCPGDQTAIATGPNGAQITFAVSATDNCDPNPFVNCNPPSGSTFPIGTTSVSCFALDNSQNTSACTIRVIVRDPPCCETKDWSVIAVTGNSPGPRKFHGMAYDSARHRVVLFGGTDASGALRNDTWEYDGTQWFLIGSPIAPPSPRQAMAMAYDANRGRVVLFGGRDSTAVLDDTWEWNGANWQKSSIAGAPTPHARWQHAMAYDSFRRKIVLFGGDFAGMAAAPFRDTWEYDAAGWVQVADVGPSGRFGHAMAATANNRVLLYGGVDYSGNPFAFLDDSWEWDGKNWVQVAAGSPLKRGAHAMYYDTYCQRTIMFGGAGVTAPFQDTWQWDETAWSQLSPATLPARRSGHAMVFDSDNGRGILYGGVSGQTTFGDMWQLRDGQGSPTPLSIVSVEANCGENKVTIVFNRGLKAASALDSSHYQINCGGIVQGVTQVQFGPDNRTVCVFTQGAIGNGCFLSLFVEDLCGNMFEQSQYPFTCDPCGTGNGGKDFWLTFPGNYAPDPTNRPKLTLHITGNPGTMGQVSAPGLSPPFLVNYTIPASRVSTVNLPSDAELGETNDVVESKGVHVTASAKVSVFGLNHLKYTSDAYMALPTNVLGKAYLVMSYRNVLTDIPELNGTEFAIVACEDNTTVGILPKDDAAGHPAGIPFLISLQKGQTYQLRGTNDAPNDLTGTIVVANKPIALFGAHRCAYIPTTNLFFCDHLVEQLWPTTLWGMDFITQRLATRKSDTFRIMAVQNNTTVRTNGTIVNGTALNLGGYHEIQLFAAVRITADKPVLVAEYANSSDYDMVTPSDPFMVLVPPVTMYGSDYTVHAPTTTDFANHYINVVAPTAAAGSVLLDGIAIGAANFGVVPGTAYSTAAVHVASGPHRLTSANTQFGAIVYGWGPEYDSYGYPAGLCAGRDQRPPPPITCPPETLTAQLGTNCSIPVPDLRGEVKGEVMFVSQDPAPGTPVGVGPTHITLVAIDIFGNTKTCLVDFVVTGGLNIFCPSGVETNCFNKGPTIVNYTIGTCDTGVVVTCSPPSGSTFPLGTTIVNCSATDPKSGAQTQCTFPVRVRCTNLTINQAAGTVTIAYSGGTLQVNSNLSTRTWSNITSNGVYTVRPTGGSKAFFRLLLDP